MKKHPSLSIFSLILILSAPLVWGEENTTSNKVFRFDVRVTDSISQNDYDGVYTVAVKDGKCFVSKEGENGSKSVEGEPSGDLCRMVGIDDEQRRYLKPPHKIGETWSQHHKYKLARYPKLDFERTVTFKVVGYEDVTVPAGTFKAFRIEGDYEEGPSRYTGAYVQKWIYYYAEERGVIVKLYFDSSVGKKGAKLSIELLSPARTASAVEEKRLDEFDSVTNRR